MPIQLSIVAIVAAKSIDPLEFARSVFTDAAPDPFVDMAAANDDAVFRMLDGIPAAAPGEVMSQSPFQTTSGVVRVRSVESGALLAGALTSDALKAKKNADWKNKFLGEAPASAVNCSSIPVQTLLLPCLSPPPRVETAASFAHSRTLLSIRLFIRCGAYTNPSGQSNTI